MPLWPRLGVRARQIALLTLLVAIVVIVTTVANIAYLTGVIINRTEEQARQLTEQISYAVQQELNHEIAVDEPNPYAVLAREHSGVRAMMESIIVTTRPISYLYVTNVSGKIITDKLGKNELAANRMAVAARDPLLRVGESTGRVERSPVLSAEVILAQLRGVVADLLLLTGMDPLEATDALPPPPS